MPGGTKETFRMSSDNVVDFADYQNRIAIANLSDGVEGSFDDDLSLTLLRMYEKGLITVGYSEDGELLFEASPTASEEEWNDARDEFLSSTHT